MPTKEETAMPAVSASINVDASLTQSAPKSQYSDTTSTCVGGVAPFSSAEAPPYLTYTDKWSSTPVENELFFQQKSLELLFKTQDLFKTNKKLLHSLHAMGFQKFKVINDNTVVLYSPSNNAGNSRAGWKLAHEDSNTDKARLASKQLAQEKALANVDVWKYFGTLTLDKKKQDRYDFKKIQRRVTRMLSARHILYFLVAEVHKDGAIHFHGLFSAELEPFLVEFEGKALKNKYIKKSLTEGKEVRDFKAYHENCGFNIIEPIRDPEACVNYMTKYVLKTFDNPDYERLSRRRFFCSKGLKSPYEVMPEFIDLYEFKPVNFSKHTVKVYLRRVKVPAFAYEPSYTAMPPPS